MATTYSNAKVDYVGGVPDLGMLGLALAARGSRTLEIDYRTG